MIIPIRCMSCGHVIAGKWEKYKAMVDEQEKKQGSNKVKNSKATLSQNFSQNLKGDILNDLGIERICCRRHFLGHVDLIDDI